MKHAYSLKAKLKTIGDYPDGIVLLPKALRGYKKLMQDIGSIQHKNKELKHLKYKKVVILVGLIGVECVLVYNPAGGKRMAI